MTLARRIWLTVGMLGAALAVQAGLLVHMAFGPKNSYPQLSQSFTKLPDALNVARSQQAPLVWRFRTLPAEKDIRPRLPFEPSDLVFRAAECPELRISAECYIVHAENGEDRKHHPEVCIRDVQQVPEDVSGRGIVLLGDESRPVQRFSFLNSPSYTTTVYYWHYTFAPKRQENQSWLQMLNETFSRSPPSVTVQVTTTAARENWPVIEQSLLAALDRELRAKHLPADVRMGCDRLPIGIVTK